MHFCRQTLTLCAGLLLASGCVHDAKRPTTGEPYAHNTNDPVPEEPQDRQMRAEAASATAPNACELAVYFDTDSARLDRSSRDHLDTVAECMKRREVDHATIIGRTDPSGSEQHNQELGLERAKAVAEYLRNRGVPEDQIRVRSKGETAAAESRDLWPTERRAGFEQD
jgi:outer membrane protein OmpA-like peptidoglycan-associated protein